MSKEIKLLGLLSVIVISGCSNNGSENNNSEINSQKVTSDRKEEISNLIKRESCIYTIKNVTDKGIIIDSKNTSTELIKENLCKNIENYLNKGEKPVNAYSSMWGANIQLADNLKPQDSFVQILNDGTSIPFWGVKDWISADGYIASIAKKKFAFGEVKSEIEDGKEFDFKTGGKVEKRKWGIWDVRFIDENGKILKATSINGLTAQYTEEGSIDIKYIKDIYGIFAISNKNKPAQIYFLKKDGKYDIKEYDDVSKTYKDILNDAEISDLFPMIPKNDLFLIDYIQKISDNQIALFKKSNGTKTYSGYYLISLNDIKKPNSSVIFVEAKGIIESSCSDKENTVTEKSICKLLQDSKFTPTGSGINFNDRSAIINDYQANKYYYISQNGILSEKNDFEFQGINSNDILIQISNQKEKATWFISKDGKKYSRYPNSINDPEFRNKEISENKWNGYYFSQFSLAENLKDATINFPLLINNLSENIIIFNSGKYVNYNSDGQGSVISSGYSNRLFPFIKQEELQNISAAFNINDEIYLLKKDKTGFYKVNENKNSETKFIKNENKSM